MKTLLPKKTNQIPLATDDEHHLLMAADPSIKEFPQGSEYGTVNLDSVQPTRNLNNFQSSQPILTMAAETTAANNAEILVKNTNEGWINKRWRPAMGWTYMAVCIFDFIIFPIMFTGVQFYETEAVNDAFRQWQPLTLQGGGLFHLAMGAVIGVTSYGRTKEKIEGKA